MTKVASPDGAWGAVVPTQLSPHESWIRVRLSELPHQAQHPTLETILPFGLKPTTEV